ncbi:MAG: hypothetical protein JWO06_1206, partial [Bacteroidota bacterium]|nr:hypothetical protein [Bacteroidota bacterium]
YVEHSPEILNFLFSELHDPISTPIHKKCLLEILFNFQTENITGHNRQLLHKELKDIIQSAQTPAVHDMAIDVMTRHMFLEASDVRFSVQKCPNNSMKIVREAILKMIKAAGADQYFNYILESALLLFPQESNSSSQLGNEFLEIILGFLNAKRAVSWLKFTVSNVNLLGTILDTMYDPLERLTIQKINLKLAELYELTKDDAILKGYTAFVGAIHANLSESKWGNLALFFINTNTREEAFFTLLKEEDTVLYRSSIGADLVDNDIIDQLVARVRSGFIKMDSLRLTRNFLHYFNHIDQFNSLNEKILAALPDFFEASTEQAVDWSELNRQRTARDFELFKSKEEFIGEAKMIYEEVASLNDFEQDWFMLEYSEKAEIKKILTNNIIFRMIEVRKLSDFEAFVDWINEWDWDYYLFTQITIYSIDQKKQLPEYWQNWLQCYVTGVLLKEIDFKKSLKKTTQGTYTATNGARQIRALFMQDMVKLPQHVLLDMVSFDTSGFVQMTPSPVSREHLFKKIIENIEDLDLFKKRILLNLTGRFPEKRVLETHCSICIFLQISEAIPLLIDHLQKKSTPADVKDSLVCTLIKLEASPEILAEELKQVKFITEDWQWELFKSVFTEVLKGNHVWEKQSCLAFAEKSIKRHKDKSRMKWRLIKASLKLGSITAAKNVLKYLNTNNSWSDYADIDTGDFAAVISFNPKKMIGECIKILGSALLNNSQDRHNSVERFLTQIVRQLAVKNYELMLFSLESYEKLIAELIDKRPELVYLRWYEKDLVSDYYIQATTFESEQEVLDIIGSIN